MNDNFEETVRLAACADEIVQREDIQSLWSGYGKIIRYRLKGSERKSVVVKHVKLPDAAHHPRGWNTDLSHQRKIKSYQVESAWYRDWSSNCNDSCRVPECLALEVADDEFLMVLEDLDESGYLLRKGNVSEAQMQVCLSWLAQFHATFMGVEPTGLWAVGTYWHLETRPDELEALDDAELKSAAKLIDACLNNARYQTFVHGDAKLANFCFSQDSKHVAAVDFQYIGGGCGMKDVAYFIGSCLYEEDCQRYETELLNFYFSELRQAMASRDSLIDMDDLEQEWRGLYPVAWTDFHRFLKGWSPGHWKINSYSEKLARQVLSQLNSVVS